MKKLLPMLLIPIILGCAQSSRYIQSVRFPEDATPEEKVEMSKDLGSRELRGEEAPRRHGKTGSGKRSQRVPQ